MDVVAHQTRLWTVITRSQTLRPVLREAFMACPRHVFLRAFRPPLEAALRQLTARSLACHLPVIYTDSILVYGPGDAADGRAAATCSEPGFVIGLLERLDPQPGQRILEIGSGGGWVAGMLGHAVGPTGHVVGVEVLAPLAAQSRASLARCGIANVTILDGDGALAEATARGPFDRILVSAGAGAVPRTWCAALAEGGLLMVPLHVPGGGEEVYRLRRTGDRLRSEGAIPAWFVPLVGAAAPPAPLDLAAEPAGARLLDQPGPRIPAWLEASSPRWFGLSSGGFRSWLHKTETGFRAFTDKSSGTLGFGLIDRARTSLALCRPGEIRGYGTSTMLDRLMRAYGRWAGRFMPPGTAFALTIDVGSGKPRAAWRLAPRP